MRHRLGGRLLGPAERGEKVCASEAGVGGGESAVVDILGVEVEGLLGLAEAGERAGEEEAAGPGVGLGRRLRDVEFELPAGLVVALQPQVDATQ